MTVDRRSFSVVVEVTAVCVGVMVVVCTDVGVTTTVGTVPQATAIVWVSVGLPIWMSVAVRVSAVTTGTPGTVTVTPGAVKRAVAVMMTGSALASTVVVWVCVASSHAVLVVVTVTHSVVRTSPDVVIVWVWVTV